MSDLEEVLLLESVVSGALEEELDVLTLLERRLHRVDLLHRARAEGVDQPGMKCIGLIPLVWFHLTRLSFGSVDIHLKRLVSPRLVERG